MTNIDLELLEGIDPDYVKERLKAAGGKEIESGKILSPESSAALAVNCFAWFNSRPELLPPFPRTNTILPPIAVEIEYSARFPWKGGRHPWLDAFVETNEEIIGVESKRFEPYRDAKNLNLSSAYWREVWGNNMKRYEKLRDQVSRKEIKFKYLDATQLIKHAFGLVTEAGRKSKKPILFYLFAEPKIMRDKLIASSVFDAHRQEANLFQELVCGDEVKFAFSSYAEWLANFDKKAKQHANNLIEKFAP